MYVLNPLDARFVSGLNVPGVRRYVSDLHALNSGPADDFALRAPLFHEFAADVRWETLRFVGDTLEGLQGAGFNAISRAYPILCQWLKHAVRGNHDPAICRLPAELIEDGVLMMHGHQADPLNSDYRIIGRLLARLAGWLERLGWKNADNPWAWPTPARLIGDRWWAYRDRYYLRWARAILERRREAGIRVLVCGHTHRAELVSLPSGQLIANCGTWASDLLPCTIVRISGDLVELLGVSRR